MEIRTDRVAFDGGELEYDVAGDGPAVVLLHPGLWDRRTWDPQFEVFAERYRVVRFDARGYGASSRLEPGRPYSTADDARAVMDAVGMSSAALVGGSVGGGTALDVAITSPERVSALVLVASGLGGMPDLTPEEEAWWSERDAAWEAAMARGDRLEARRIQIEAWAGMGLDDEAGRRILQIAVDNLHEMEADESAAVHPEPPAFERLGEIVVPTLVLPAEHDPPEMARIARTLADGIPGARLVEIPGTDHVVNLRRPEPFNEIVLGFLAEVLG